MRVIPNLGLIIASLAAPSQAQDILINSGDMYRNSDGRIDYRLVARVPVNIFKPSLRTFKDLDPEEEPQGTYELRNIDRALRVNHAYWIAPWGLFEPRSLTRAQVLAAGVTQEELDALDALESPSDSPVDRSIYPITFFEESRMAINAPTELYPNIAPGFRRTGELNILATIPADHPSGRWGLTLTNALGEERSLVLSLAPGARQIRVVGLEAGNCLVRLFALSATGQASTYFQEVPVVVRKTQPGLAKLEFKNFKDSNRYQIASLALGQNSQVQGEGEDSLPLQEGKDAMVRLLVADRFGSGGAGSLPCQVNLVLEWQGSVLWSTTLDTKAKPQFAKTGRVGDYFGQPGPVIPGDRLKSGAILRATLVDKATGQVLHETTHAPTVIRPRHIVIHGYDIRPVYTDCDWFWFGPACYPVWGSGAPLARDVNAMNTRVLPYVREVFPYSTIEYRFESKVWLPMEARGLAFSTKIHLAMQEIQGRRQTNPNAPVEHIYLGMVNSSYGSVSTPGMAWYGYRAMAITSCKDYQGMGYLIAHELGHSFRLEHAPSEGANAYVAGLHLNRVDADYPYTGAGMSGGWGYSQMGNWFLSEDAHAVYNRTPHWDVMSYYQAPATWNTNVSDFFIRKYLVPSWAYSSAPEAPLVHEEAAPRLTAERVEGGTPIYGASASEETSAWIRSLGHQVEAAIPSRIDWTKVDPSKGDPDDPTPPGFVFKQLPVVVPSAN